MRFRRRRAPDRRPHPDPRSEARIQRVLSLQRAAARKETGLDDLGEAVHQLREVARVDAGDRRGDSCLKQITQIAKEQDELQAEIAKLHDEIAERLAALSDEELLYVRTPGQARSSGK
jgi:uncharacterized coiled-coil DUF342 family protein